MMDDWTGPLGAFIGIALAAGCWIVARDFAPSVTAFLILME